MAESDGGDAPASHDAALGRRVAEVQDELLVILLMGPEILTELEGMLVERIWRSSARWSTPFEQGCSGSFATWSGVTW